MTTFIPSPGGAATASAAQGYAGSDELIADLQGHSGEARRLFAQGYVAAIRDADAGRSGSEFCEPVQRSDAAHGRRHRAGERMAWFAALCLGVAVAGWACRSVSSGRTSTFQQDLLLSRQAAEIRTLLLEERRYEKDAFINIKDHERGAAYAQKWYESRVALLNTLSRTGELPLSEPDRQAVRNLAADFRLYALGFEQVLSMIRSGRVRSAPEANEQFERYKDAVHRIEAGCAEIQARAQRRIDRTI